MATRASAPPATSCSPHTLDGCGERASQVRRGITVSTHGQEIARLLFYEDLQQVVLVGISSGGMVVCRAAEQARDRIARLVFVDAPRPPARRGGRQDRQARGRE